MFEMRYTNKFGSTETVVVYDVTYDKESGYPLFLVYLDGQWLRKSAKHFKPIEQWV